MYYKKFIIFNYYSFKYNNIFKYSLLLYKQILRRFMLFKYPIPIYKYI